MQSNRDDVRRKAGELLREGFLSPVLDPALHIGEPLPVMNPNGTQHSWLVPLEAGGKLAGFAQLLTSLVPLRVSSFQRRPHDFQDCPDIADWIDIQSITARASSLAKPGERLSKPLLTYDGSPDRLAWKIEATSSSGEKRNLFVAGTAAYEESPSRGLV